MALKAVYSIAISEIPAKFKHEVANILWKKLQEYKIAVTSEGDFIDTATGDTLKLNHIKCILRNDSYMNAGHNEYGSTDLNVLIDGILTGARAATKATCSRLQLMPDNAKLLAAENMEKYDNKL
jgi:hypothetical protein